MNYNYLGELPSKLRRLSDRLFKHFSDISPLLLKKCYLKNLYSLRSLTNYIKPLCMIVKRLKIPWLINLILFHSILEFLKSKTNLAESLKSKKLTKTVITFAVFFPCHIWYFHRDIWFSCLTIDLSAQKCELIWRRGRRTVGTLLKLRYFSSRLMQFSLQLIFLDTGSPNWD